MYDFSGTPPAGPRGTLSCLLVGLMPPAPPPPTGRPRLSVLDCVSPPPLQATAVQPMAMAQPMNPAVTVVAMPQP